MSLIRKSNPDTADRQLLMLPDLPVLDGLSKAGQASFADWWHRTREALKREDDIIRSLIGGAQDSQSNQQTQDSSTTVVSIGGSGVTRDEVEQIVDESVASAIENARYIHSQGFPSAEWVVIHNLGWKPSVTVIDSVGSEVYGDVKHDSTTQLRIGFTYSFSGSAYLT